MPYKCKEKRRECARKWAAEWRARDREHSSKVRRQFYLNGRERHARLERKRRIAKYGMTIDEYEEKKSLYLICPICETRKVSVLDHNHETGQIRDFLCTQCNLNLHAIENKTYLAKALLYLAKFEREAA